MPEILQKLKLRAGQNLCLYDEPDFWLRSKQTPEAFILKLRRRIGPSATLVIASFFNDFLDGKPYDLIRSTTGSALGQAALRDPGFRRTKHPLFSFAVSGKDQELFISNFSKNLIGNGSIFDLFEDFEVLVLGSDFFLLDLLTRHVEAKSQVDYLQRKVFTGEVVSNSGEIEFKQFEVYEPGVAMEFRSKSLLEILLAHGGAKQLIVDKCSVTLLNCKKSLELIASNLLGGGRSIRVPLNLRARIENLVRNLRMRNAI